MSYSDYINEKLIGLGNTEEEAVEWLTANGITGFPGHTDRCILSQYLKYSLGETFVTTVPFSTEYGNQRVGPSVFVGPYARDDRERVDLPEHLVKFATNFDHGKYPDLIDPKSGYANVQEMHAAL